MDWLIVKAKHRLSINIVGNNYFDTLSNAYFSLFPKENHRVLASLYIRTDLPQNLNAKMRRKLFVFLCSIFMRLIHLFLCKYIIVKYQLSLRSYSMRGLNLKKIKIPELKKNPERIIQFILGYKGRIRAQENLQSQFKSDI